MSRTLNRAVLASGVIYEEGTQETPELAELIANSDFWDGEAEPEAEPEPEPEPEPERPIRRSPKS